jgi:hypothetical protein
LLEARRWTPVSVTSALPMTPWSRRRSSRTSRDSSFVPPSQTIDRFARASSCLASPPSLAFGARVPGSAAPGARYRGLVVGNQGKRPSCDPSVFRDGRASIPACRYSAAGRAHTRLPTGPQLHTACRTKRILGPLCTSAGPRDGDGSSGGPSPTSCPVALRRPASSRAISERASSNPTRPPLSMRSTLRPSAEPHRLALARATPVSRLRARVGPTARAIVLAVKHPPALRAGSEWQRHRA